MKAEYNIVEDDLKSFNKRIFIKYVVIYAVVALIAIGVGICTQLLARRQSLIGAGIALIVLGALLAVCAIFMAITPKNYHKSAFDISADNYPTGVNVEITLGDSIFSVLADGKETSYMYADINKIQQTPYHVAIHLKNSTTILMVKSEYNTSVLNAAKYFESKLSSSAVSPVQGEMPTNSPTQAETNAQTAEPNSQAETNAQAEPNAQAAEPNSQAETNAQTAEPNAQTAEPNAQDKT